jgi:cell division protein FtsI/penicillin-binding protein 2
MKDVRRVLAGYETSGAPISAIDPPLREECDHKPARRLVVTQAILVGFALLIVAQLVRWQVIQRGAWKDMPGAGIGYRAETLEQRGVLLDRHYTVLALNSYEYEVFAAPNQIPEADTADVGRQLALAMGWPVEEMVAQLEGDALYAPLERHVPLEVGKAILDLRLPGIYARPLSVRVYPEGSLAAHTLGFVAGDAEEGSRGYYGLEGFYDKVLKKKADLGKDAISSFQLFGSSQPFPFVDTGVYSPVSAAQRLSGQTLVLTLDKTIQFLIEQELQAAVERYGAEGGSILVLEPKTGALLASASYPTYDPRQFAAVDDALFVDPAIGRAYEPGSTFKVITMAAALETGLVRPQDVYNDVGSIEVGGRTFKNWDEKAYGPVTMWDILAYSLNTGIAHVSVLLEPARFYHYVDRFGFGRKTGIDLEGEVPGRVRNRGDAEWHESDLGTNAFGQGLAVTPLQMVTAVGAIANRGYLMKPHVAARMIEGPSRENPSHGVGTSMASLGSEGTAQGRALNVRLVTVGQVVSEETAQTLTEMMVDAVERGAPLARVDGYRIAGKTGTAQTPIVGGYHPSLTIASFVGFAPADDPRFVALVKLDKPTVSPWGAQTAAPTFANVARILLSQLAVPPEVGE